MSTQLTIEAIDQVIEAGHAHANSEWRRVALESVRLLSNTREFFTTDEVWELLEPTGFTTSDPRALGGVMRAARAAGYIKPTLDMKKSQRPGCHYRPITIWISLRASVLPRSANRGHMVVNVDNIPREAYVA